jgi:hypothetical protein
MDLKVKGASLAGIVSSVESLSSQSRCGGDIGTCDVDFPLFLTIYSVNTGLLLPPSPGDRPTMWIPSPSGLWQKVSLCNPPYPLTISPFSVAPTKGSRSSHCLSDSLSRHQRPRGRELLRGDGGLAEGARSLRCQVREHCQHQGHLPRHALLSTRSQVWLLHSGGTSPILSLPQSLSFLY